MELISKLEKIVLGWAKDVPHLPIAARKWLGTNVWWIVLVGAILTGISVLVSLAGLFRAIDLLGSVSSLYYVGTGYAEGLVVDAAITLVFSAIVAVLMGLAVKPLQLKQLKGWRMLFLILLVEALSVLVNAVVGFSFFGFIFTLIFGAIGLAIGAYFVTEIREEFGVTAKKTAPKKA